MKTKKKLTFSIHKSYICDTACIGHSRVPHCKIQTQTLHAWSFTSTFKACFHGTVLN